MRQADELLDAALGIAQQPIADAQHPTEQQQQAQQQPQADVGQEGEEAPAAGPPVYGHSTTPWHISVVVGKKKAATASACWRAVYILCAIIDRIVGCDH